MKKFGNVFTPLVIVSAALIGYMWDNSTTQYQLNILVMVAVMLLVLCALIAFVFSMPQQQVPRVSRLTPQERENAAMFRHYPNSATFRVRMTANEQQRRKRYAQTVHFQ